MKYILSKKSIFIILLFTTVIVGGFVIINSSKGPLNNSIVFEKKSNENLSKTLIKTFEIDTDNDGLKDWEESLWKTDIKNPDTDGDGTKDGDEIKEGRDPLKQGPNDKTEQQNKFPIKITYEKPSTATGVMAEDFFSKYLELKASGNLNEKTKVELINSVVGNINIENNIKTYTADDLKIIANTPENFKKYGNTLAYTLIKYTEKLDPDSREMTIMNKAIKQDNIEYFQKLSPVIFEYKNLSKKLLSINTPTGATRTHLELINTYENIAKALEDIKESSLDPIRGLMGISKYNKSISQISTIAKKTSNMFTENKIIFKENELGAGLIIKAN